jgi:HMG (high mobility group) box
VGKILGEKWKELSDKERKPYDEKARVDKERYENEKARYQGVSASGSPSAPLTSPAVRGSGLAGGP